MKPSLCLNMIVKNEAARIDRCLASVLPYVKAVVILDTGSTDDTKDKIRRICELHRVPCIIGNGEFKNFSQARNDAFALAQEHVQNRFVPHCRFALLVDADMQLIVEDEKAFGNLNASAASYDMMQRGGAISYANRRLVNLSWGKPPYVGVTHEYIDIPAAGMIKGASFIDYADGANRPGKFQRDAALLEEALEKEPDNARYWYYLGNSYRDAGAYNKAIDAYTKRIAMGGWEEETHSAMMHRADCYRKLGQDGVFMHKMLEAYSFRPSRCEPLYELARYHRELGNNHTATIFAKHALTIPRPNDVLFVNDFAYSHGNRYEYSIAGYYVDAERSRAVAITNDLVLDPTTHPDIRSVAKRNLFFGTKKLAEMAPSFKAKKLEFTPPDGYVAMNPSVEQHGGIVLCNIRCVNYTIDQHGRYLIRGTNGECNQTNPIDTRNFIVALDADFGVHSPREIVWDRGAPKFPLVTGLEDVRIWRYGGALNFNACVRELLDSGTPQQVTGRLRFSEMNNVWMAELIEPISDGRICEKNWMHCGGRTFVYRLGQFVTAGQYPHIERTDTPFHVDEIAGSSQAIPFKGGTLCVVHEASAGPDGKRTYWHRFAWMNNRGEARRISMPFVFCDRQIEFCAGLAYHPNHNTLLVSFGVRDAEAWVGSISAEDVAQMLGTFHES